MNFYLDPYILAIERDNISKEKLEEFISNLIDWKKLIDLNWGSVYKPSESFDLLFKHNLYPLVDIIKELTQKYHIDYIQPEEIDKIVNSILNKIPTIEESSKISDVLIETDNLSVNGRRNDDFIYLLKKLTTILGIDCVLNKKNTSGQILITKEIDKPVFQYEAIISLIDCECKIDLPYAVNIEFSYFENFTNFCKEINPSIVWLNATSNLCIKMAVYIKIYQADDRLDYICCPDDANFFLNDSFFRSMTNLGFHRDQTKSELLLRALHEEILQTSMKDTHELREGKSGGSKQISHKGYLAWRRDIDYEYHLHYWRKGNEIVFTDVVPHNNFRITKI